MQSADSQNFAMSSSIQTVGVIGAGVIGASWTALFLAKGLKVIVTDPAPGAEAKLRDYLQEYCSEVPNAIVAPAACLKNYTFVRDIEPYLGSLDLIQEVSDRSTELLLRLIINTNNHARMDRRDWTLNAVCLHSWTQRHLLISSSHLRPPAFLRQNLSLNAPTTHLESLSATPSTLLTWCLSSKLSLTQEQVKTM